jgi:hypothetical protein
VPERFPHLSATHQYGIIEMAPIPATFGVIFLFERGKLRQKCQTWPEWEAAGGLGVLQVLPDTRNPNSESRNPTPESRNPKPETQNARLAPEN